jgi:6-phosphogluconolactonase
MLREIVVLPDSDAVADEAARRLAEIAQKAIASRGRFTMALSGGSTPRLLFERLSQEPYRSGMAWDRVHLFWGDERCVPPDDPGSNYRQAHQAWIAHVPIPSAQVHRVPGEWEPEQAARQYEETLRRFSGGGMLRFDLILLGLGADGHTASLFPGSTTLEERERWVLAVAAEYEGRPAHRVTLTLPILNAGRQVLFLVTGKAKAEIVRAVLQGPGEQLPAQKVQPTAGEVVWLLDEEAAHLGAPGAG